jgi:hypothetical protein
MSRILDGTHAGGLFKNECFHDKRLCLLQTKYIGRRSGQRGTKRRCWNLPNPQAFSGKQLLIVMTNGIMLSGPSSAGPPHQPMLHNTALESLPTSLMLSLNFLESFVAPGTYVEKAFIGACRSRDSIKHWSGIMEGSASRDAAALQEKTVPSAACHFLAGSLLKSREYGIDCMRSIVLNCLMITRPILMGY